MKVRWWPKRARALFWVFLFVAYSVAAVGVVVLDVMEDGYDGLSQVSTTTVYAPEDARNLAASQIAALYRARSGMPFTSLPPGSTVRIVWPDGSSEYVAITNPAASAGVRPIPGTQMDVFGRPVSLSSPVPADPGGISPVPGAMRPAPLLPDPEDR